ncbi:hypothetical protein THIOM_000650 [Candidatus Thiomargarita nelsonii]|uniref:Uncharacterized protein n=1 Tax=Candidatus Thiomargarita nelsonii TaxID=1003181 RepID=A0A176S5Z3_9GAMM|nr:hypothetical protein THIOM_000650 [Candidatus Thiomargarita nelsonii]
MQNLWVTTIQSFIFFNLSVVFRGDNVTPKCFSSSFCKSVTSVLGRKLAFRSNKSEQSQTISVCLSSDIGVEIKKSW